CFILLGIFFGRSTILLIFSLAFCLACVIMLFIASRVCASVVRAVFNIYVKRCIVEFEIGIRRVFMMFKASVIYLLILFLIAFTDCVIKFLILVHILSAVLRNTFKNVLQSP